MGWRKGGQGGKYCTLKMYVCMKYMKFSFTNKKLKYTEEKQKVDNDRILFLCHCRNVDLDYSFWQTNDGLIEYL